MWFPSPMKQLNYPFSVLPPFRSLLSAFFASHLSFSRSGCLLPFTRFIDILYIFCSQFAQLQTWVHRICADHNVGEKYNFFFKFLVIPLLFQVTYLLGIPWVIWFMCSIWYAWIPWLLQKSDMC